MTVTIYCEGSLSHETGAAGWAASLRITGHDYLLSGSLPGQKARGLTLCELHAVQSALEKALSRNVVKVGDAVVLAMRSTATIAVLRWIFPDAPYEGPPQQQVPKSLRPETRDFGPIKLLQEDVARYGLGLTIRYVGHNRYSMAAKDQARAERLVLQP